MSSNGQATAPVEEPNTKPDSKETEVNLTIHDSFRLSKNKRDKVFSEAYNNPVFVSDQPSDHITPNFVEEVQTEERSVSEESDSNNRAQASENLVSRALTGLETALGKLYERHSALIKWVVCVTLFIGYNVYLGFAIYLKWVNTCSWCDGVKFLIVLSAFAYFLVLYYKILKRGIVVPIANYVRRFQPRYAPIIHSSWFFRIAWLTVAAAILVFVVVDCRHNYYRLVSVGGLIVIVALGYIFSAYPRKIIWRHVFCGLLMQFILGLLVLRWSVGREFFDCVGSKVKTFLDFTDAGSSFVFGYLSSGKLTGLPEQQPIFAFKVLSVVIFFSFNISILYFFGIMQVVILKVGWFLSATMGSTACESMSVAANIFLGMTEAPLVIRPYLNILTKSELHAVMTGGFATISGSVMAAYINFGVSPSHLLTASVMSAPAALACSKLFYPETEVSKTSTKNIVIHKSTERNAIEAAANGAASAVALIANIAANLIAFLAFIHFLNSILSWFADLVGGGYITFEWILAQVFRPLAFVMGVRWDECENVGKLIGLKTVINEFVAYQQLGKMQRENILSPRAEAISVFALCGFSNIGSIGITLGSLTTMAPERKSDLAAVAVRAMIAGCMACFTTACVAGVLLDESVRPIGILSEKF